MIPLSDGECFDIVERELGLDKQTQMDRRTEIWTTSAPDRAKKGYQFLLPLNSSEILTKYLSFKF